MLSKAPSSSSQLEEFKWTADASPRQHELAALDNEIASHYAQIALLKAKRNSLAPICSLPNELLCRIFIIYAVESDTLFDLKWTQIMYVCHHWHNLAVATQPLWSYIQLGWERNVLSRLYNQVDRSGAAPLTIKIHRYEGHYTDEILRNSGRIQALEASGEAKHIYVLIHSLSESNFPLLTSLDFNFSSGREELPGDLVQALPDEVFDGRMPQLRELVLRSVALPWRSLRGLTSLCLTECGNATSLPHTFDVLLAMLDASPRLQTLRLEQTIPAPIPDQHYPTVNLPDLVWLRVRDDVATCTTTLNHLRFPSTTSVHVIPYGVHAGPNVADLLIPLRKHLRAPAAREPRLVHVQGNMRHQSSHFMTSLFCDTAVHDAFAVHKAHCPFSLNSHPANEGELRRIMTKILKAIPVEAITHLDAGATITTASWKAALRLLPSLDTVYLTQFNSSAISFCAALDQIEHQDPEHHSFPRVRRLHIRVVSLAPWRAIRGDPEEPEDYVALLFTPLQAYLRSAFENGHALPVLVLEDEDSLCLSGHERELDQLFPLIGESMVRNNVVYDPAKRKADREAREVERRALEIEYGLVESN
ncbi:hypothetical protein C8R43DRAFT_1238304 [Mycena crocata]|nr:hypothetical protein C8R43DRAFT_1238304 [Mycena crocata]